MVELWRGLGAKNERDAGGVGTTYSLIVLYEDR